MSLTVISEPLGNLDAYPVGDRHLERVGVHSDDLAKRLLRLTTSRGDVGLRFEGEQRVRDGDIVHADEELVVAVRVRPDDVLVVRPVDMRQALEIAHALGNRHLPAQFEADGLVVRYQRLIEELLREHDVPHAREERVLVDAFRHAHAPHNHE